MMFELPEIETVRRDLDKDLPGKRVKIVEAASMKVLGRYKTRKSFADQMPGWKVLGVSRVGLYLLVAFDSESTMVVDLGSSGSLRRHANKDPHDPDTEIVMTFTQHGQLRLVDAEGTSSVFVIDSDALAEEIPEIENYGLDPVDEPVSWTAFGRVLLQRKAKLKTLLMDPTFVIGISNIYADEILYHAGLRYDRPSDSLSSQEIRRLHRSVVGTLHDAIKHRGTSTPERPFVDPFGQSGDYGDHLEVWGKHNQLSGRNRRAIKRSKFGGVWTYYCDTQV